MKNANLVFNYCRNAFPNDRNVIEDYSNESDIMRIISKSQADLYLLSATEADEKNESYLRIAREIRIRHRDRDILFTVSNSDVTKSIINNRLFPSFLFENEVTMNQIEEYFGFRKKHQRFGNILTFTSGSQKQFLNVHSLFLAQAKNKRVILHTIDHKYTTTLTIASLEEKLPKNFIRLDKGILVNGDYINHYDSSTETISLVNGIKLEVSRRGKQRLNHAFLV